MSTIAPWLSVRDATAALAFYRNAFGAVPEHVLEIDGVVQVAQLSLNGAVFWLQQDDDLPPSADPGRAVRMILEVDDPDTAFGRALDAGATGIAAVHEEHGWRTGRLADPFGHQWEFARRSH